MHYRIFRKRLARLAIAAPVWSRAGRRFFTLLCATVLTLVAFSNPAQAQGVVVFEDTEHARATLRQLDAGGQWQDDAPIERTQLLQGQNSWRAPDLSHPQRVLVLLIGANYRSAPRAEVRAMFDGAGPNSLKSFYERESGGRLTFAPFVFQELVLPDENGCRLPTEVLLARYREVSGVDQVPFDQVFLLGAVDHTRCPIGPYYSASATMGDMRLLDATGSHELGVSWFQDQYYGPHMVSLVLHEYGHNLGWDHSNIVSPEFDIEYGDHRDIMGGGQCCQRNAEISATRRMVMGWPAEVRRIQPFQYGQSWELKRNPAAPMVLVLPLSRVVVKAPLYGRPLLALTLDSAVHYSDGTVRRPAGIVPRLITPELPASEHNLLYDPQYVPTQSHIEQVMSVPGSHAIPGTTLTVLVEQIGPDSARIRVVDAALPGSVRLNSVPAANACYHRELRVDGAPAPVQRLSWSVGTGGVREAFGAVDTPNDQNRALFAGNASLSVGGWVRNADGSHTNYGFDTPKADCPLQAPLLKVAQQRASAEALDCGTVISNVSYSGTRGIPLVAQAGGELMHFSGPVTLRHAQSDSRRGVTTFWMERQDDLRWGQLGYTYVPPVECPGRPVPQLAFSAPIVSADCRTLTLEVRQELPGPAGSFLFLDVQHTLASETLNCNLPAALPGVYRCQWQTTASLQGVRYVAQARTDSDVAAQRGTLSCPGN